MQDYPPMVSKNLSEAIYGDEHWAVDKNGDSKMYRSSNGFFMGKNPKTPRWFVHLAKRKDIAKFHSTENTYILNMYMKMPETAY
jgi:hypothetical protein